MLQKITAEQMQAYAFNLKPPRLQELVENLPQCYTAFVQDLSRFCDFLEDLEAD